MTELFEHGYAVVIGIDDNQIPRLALPTVAKDVKAVSDVLVHPERCAYKPENVRLLSGKESTRSNILDAFYWLREQVAQDSQATAIIYYSGHGMEDKDTNQYYLIPYDIRAIGRLRADALKAEELTAEISAIDAPRMLVILDCCHAAGMDVKDIELDASGKSPNVEAASFPIDQPETRDIPAYTAVPGSKDVSDLLEGEGRAILNSSTGAQSSYVRKDKVMSLFTYHLIEALTGHAPHPDDATVVYVTDVMSWVTHQVKKSAASEGVQQTPVMRTSGVFPVAQLIGGKGVAMAKGAIPPDPLEPLPPAGPTVTFNQERQKVFGPQVNIGQMGGDIGQIGDTINVAQGGEFVRGNRVVHGDEIHGNQVGGDSITVGDISGSSGVAVGRGASATVTTGGLPGAKADREELQKLVIQLSDLLAQVPASQQGTADAVARTADILLASATDPKPNPTLVQGLGDSLKQMAGAFAANLPQIIEAAGKVAAAAALVARAAD